VTVDELAEMIWGDALPAGPRKVIHTYVARLRRVLGDGELIQSRPEGYLSAVAPMIPMSAGSSCSWSGPAARLARETFTPSRPSWLRRWRCDAASRWPTCPRRSCIATRSPGWPNSA